MNAIYGLVAFALGWKVWTWYGRALNANVMDRPLILNRLAAHIVASGMILLCLLSSFFFFYRAQSWLAFAPVILASVLTLRLRQANRRKVWKFSATFVEAYSEAIKSGRSATDAKQAAFAAVGEANLFAAGTSAGSPLYHDLFSLLRWRSYVPRTDENLLAQMNDARLLSNQLLEINGLPAEQEE